MGYLWFLQYRIAFLIVAKLPLDNKIEISLTSPHQVRFQRFDCMMVDLWKSHFPLFRLDNKVVEQCEQRLY